MWCLRRLGGDVRASNLWRVHPNGVLMQLDGRPAFLCDLLCTVCAVFGGATAQFVSLAEATLPAQAVSPSHTLCVAFAVCCSVHNSLTCWAGRHSFCYVHGTEGEGAIKDVVMYVWVIVHVVRPLTVLVQLPKWSHGGSRLRPSLVACRASVTFHIGNSWDEVDVGYCWG